MQLVGIVLEIVELHVVDVGVVLDVSRAAHPLEGIVFACAGSVLVLVLLLRTGTAFSIEVDEFVAVGAYTIVLAGDMPGGVVIIMIVETLSPVLGLFALE